MSLLDDDSKGRRTFFILEVQILSNGVNTRHGSGGLLAVAAACGTAVVCAVAAACGIAGLAVAAACVVTVVCAVVCCDTPKTHPQRCERRTFAESAPQQDRRKWIDFFGVHPSQGKCRDCCIPHSSHAEALPKTQAYVDGGGGSQPYGPINQIVCFYRYIYHNRWLIIQ